MAPVPTLAVLREAVLARSEKRSPKWKFRLAPDLVVEIQPKPVIVRNPQKLLLFKCAAVLCEGATAGMLTSRKDIDRDYWKLGFEIYAFDSAEWLLKPLSGRWRRGAGEHRWLDLPSRIISELGIPHRFDVVTPDLMLTPHCLCCGKGFTDPVSMARGIGPECAGTASAEMKRIIRLMTVEA
jgi:hypothetical protein